MTAAYGIGTTQSILEKSFCAQGFLWLNYSRKVASNFIHDRPAEPNNTIASIRVHHLARIHIDRLQAYRSASAQAGTTKDQI